MSLRSVSDSEILTRIQDLIRREREATLLILLHLNEIERRKLHLKLGYPSLFDYCTDGLGYSASAAGRRIQTARCIARFPSVYDLLAKNEVNVSTVSQVARTLTDENQYDLLARIRGKSQREVEAILAEYQPVALPPDRVRTVVVRVPAMAARPMSNEKERLSAVRDGGLFVPADSTPISDPAPAGPCENSTYSRNGSDCPSSPSSQVNERHMPSENGTTETTRLQSRVVIQFSASPEFMTKLGRVRSLIWHRLPPHASLEQVFGLALDMLIDREDPAKRIERRERRGRRTNVNDSPPAERAAAHVDPSTRARYIPTQVRDRVFARDGGRCTFVGVGGRRCGVTHGLQMDHIVPVARGGAGTLDNLRLLCAHHNRLEAERLLGPVATARSFRGG